MFHYGQEYFQHHNITTPLKSLCNPRHTAMYMSPILKDITYCVGTKPLLFVTLIKKFNVWEMDPEGNKLAIYVMICSSCEYTVCHQKVCDSERMIGLTRKQYKKNEPERT